MTDDSIMQPLYQLIFEVFELTGIFKWLPRTLVSLVQVTYGKSISRCEFLHAKAVCFARLCHRLGVRPSVCPSVRPSVRHTRELYQNGAS